MAEVKRIVCLANSRKLGGRCVAGRELKRGKASAWIRPVSDSPEEELWRSQIQYQDGREPELLDIIDIPLLEHRPRDHQRENWLIAPGKRWKKAGRMSWKDVTGLVDEPECLGPPYSGYVNNDRIPSRIVAKLSSSIGFIRVPGIVLSVCRNSHGAKAVRARFNSRGAEYSLAVTDPTIEREAALRDFGDYGLGDAYLTVSVGEPYRGNCYKLVAAVLRKS